MIQEGSLLDVTDNTGVKKVKCIKVLKKKFGYIGDIIIVTVKKTNTKSKIKKGSVVKAFIINTKSIFSNNFIYYKFNYNKCILIDKDLKPIGSRIFGIVLNNYNYLIDIKKKCNLLI